MTHIYPAFGDAPLPLHRQRYQHDPTSALPSLQRVVDGYYDIYGADIADPAMLVIPITGLYIGEVEYLVDETGDILVDESGDPLIAGDAKTMLRSQVQALREVVRTRDTLWRARVDEQSVLEWKTARLMQLRLPTNFNDLYIAEVTATFETSMTNWHAATATTVSGTAEDGIELPLVVENDGTAQVDDAIVTIAHVFGTITAVTITCEELGVDLEWTGELTSGETLTIDASGDAPPDDAEDAYDGFEYGDDHTQDGWLSLPRGLYVFTVTVTGGDADVTLSFYEQEP